MIMDNKNDTLTNDFLLEIIDLFDGWLTDKGVRVKNEDRDKDKIEFEFMVVGEMMTQERRNNGSD